MIRIIIISLLFVYNLLFSQDLKKADNISFLIQNGQYQTAQSKLDSLLQIKKHQKDPYYYYLKGRVNRGIYESLNQSDYQEKLNAIQLAFNSFLEAYKLSGDQNNVYLNSASQLLSKIIDFSLELNQNKESNYSLILLKETYNKSLKNNALKNSSIASIGLNYATLLEQNENNDSSIAVYEKLISKNYYLPEIFLNLSYLYQSQNDYDKALDVLIQGRNSYPYDKTILVDITNYTLLSEKKDEILSELETQFTLDSSNINLAISIATLFDKLESYEKAKKYYLIAIKLNPEFNELRFNLGVLLYNQILRLNKFLSQESSELSFRDINAQRNVLIKECKSQFEILREKEFKINEVKNILDQLEQL